MYQLQNVTKSYERRGQTVTALNSANLDIADEDFVAIVGPSGSGKTTLLSVLGGMLAPTSGIVSLDGESLYDLSVEERTAIRAQKIGFVFQTFNLIPWLTACENVQIPLLLAKKPADEQRERALEMLERVGLADRIDHRPGELSQGQQQRVALARTLANDPQVILADEPTGNLDSETRERVLEYLTEFQHDGRTIVMVTHDEAAAAYANRRIRLVEGVIQEIAVSNAA
ncbi:MAG: ABC transporter [Rubinisphaera sp.]|uniref:ABC transporter ATP-binding protein n=1 Tax=Rubinisphaera sp. TaxID=2024857 RepID=UPI000C0E5809|nr:ABC transporter ATP-binding protein [Rubinisphaera sp.]MBV07862.1 ABC transporter [Rubinisphaera sp.]